MKHPQWSVDMSRERTCRVDPCIGGARPGRADAGGCLVWMARVVVATARVQLSNLGLQGQLLVNDGSVQLQDGPELKLG